MPAAYIHENIAQNALEGINSIPSFIKDENNAFELGAQGPDILFFYNILKFWDNDYIPNRLGEYMHKHKVNDFIRTAFISAKRSGGAALAWIAGFVVHYAVDSTIHPFVYARTSNNDGSENILEHLMLEAQFDTWCYRSQGYKGIPRQAQCTKAITKVQKTNIAQLLSYACSEVYPEKMLSFEQAFESIGDMNRVISLLYSPFKIKHSIYSIIETLIRKPLIITSHEVAQKLPKYDFLNLNKDMWINPWEPLLRYHYSLPELFDISVRKSTKYIQTTISYINEELSIDDALLVFGNNSYISGLPLKED